jgi:hypothetical protein
LGGEGVISDICRSEVDVKKRMIIKKRAQRKDEKM